MIRTKTHNKESIMKLYIYEIETKKVNAIAVGETNEECEQIAAPSLWCEDLAATYTPAFGTVDGLIENPDALIMEYNG
jgi:hypothetical protein